MHSAVGIIPVRFASTRFPGKPLALILGKPMLQWVYEGARSSQTLTNVIIATDDERIAEAAEKFGAAFRMTSPLHTSGTTRAAEVASGLTEEIVINIQGDEPLVRGEEIDSLVSVLAEGTVRMATLYTVEHDLSLIQNPNIVKVIMDHKARALCFSRSPLPHAADDFFCHHIGIYGYTRDCLLGFDTLPPSRLERIERLEQLRALENGWEIRLVKTTRPGLSVDTAEDIIRVEHFLKRESNG